MQQLSTWCELGGPSLPLFLPECTVESSKKWLEIPGVKDQRCVLDRIVHVIADGQTSALGKPDRRAGA